MCSQKDFIPGSNCETSMHNTNLVSLQCDYEDFSIDDNIYTKL